MSGIARRRPRTKRITLAELEGSARQSSLGHRTPEPARARKKEQNTVSLSGHRCCSCFSPTLEPLHKSPSSAGTIAWSTMWLPRRQIHQSQDVAGQSPPCGLHGGPGRGGNDLRRHHQRRARRHQRRHGHCAAHGPAMGHERKNVHGPNMATLILRFSSGATLSCCADYSEATAEQNRPEVLRLIATLSTGPSHSHSQSRHTRNHRKSAARTRPWTLPNQRDH